MCSGNDRIYYMIDTGSAIYHHYHYLQTAMFYLMNVFDCKCKCIYLNTALSIYTLYVAVVIEYNMYIYIKHVELFRLERKYLFVTIWWF